MRLPFIRRAGQNIALKHVVPPERGQIPITSVRAFVLSDSDLAGTKISIESGLPYVCVVMFGPLFARRAPKAPRTCGMHNGVTYGGPTTCPDWCEVG